MPYNNPVSDVAVRQALVAVAVKSDADEYEGRRETVKDAKAFYQSSVADDKLYDIIADDALFTTVDAVCCDEYEEGGSVRAFSSLNNFIVTNADNPNMATAENKEKCPTETLLFMGFAMYDYNANAGYDTTGLGCQVGGKITLTASYEDIRATDVIVWDTPDKGGLGTVYTRRGMEITTTRRTAVLKRYSSELQKLDANDIKGINDLNRRCIGTALTGCREGRRFHMLLSNK